MKNLRKLALAGATAALATGALAGPAAAQTTTVEQISATGTFQGVLTGSGLTVTYECAATSTGATASTNITRCGIFKNSALALPFNASVVAGVESVPLAPFSLCWSATATFVSGRTKSTSGCTTPQPAPGVEAPQLAGGGVSSSAL